MWENIIVGLLVTVAALCVIRRLVKGAGSGCGSCKCCDDADAGASCATDQTDATDKD